MKITRFFYIPALLLLVAGFPSCSSQDVDSPVAEGRDGVTLRISAVIDRPDTRSPFEGDSFKDGDEIGVFVLMNDQEGDGMKPYHDYSCENVRFVKSGNQWWSSTEIKVSNDTTAYMVAYYPYTSDYSSGDCRVFLNGYDDIMTSMFTGIDEDGYVTLHFNHIYTRLVFNVRKGANYKGEGALNSIRVDNGALLDTATGSVLSESSDAVAWCQSLWLTDSHEPMASVWTHISNDDTNVPSYLYYGNTRLSESTPVSGTMMIKPIGNTGYNVQRLVNIRITVDGTEYTLKTFAPDWYSGTSYTYNILVDELNKETVITIADANGDDIEAWEPGDTKDKEFEL